VPGAGTARVGAIVHPIAAGVHMEDSPAAGGSTDDVAAKIWVAESRVGEVICKAAGPSYGLQPNDSRWSVVVGRWLNDQAKRPGQTTRPNDQAKRPGQTTRPNYQAKLPGQRSATTLATIYLVVVLELVAASWNSC
jgi:hypothetical protein